MHAVQMAVATASWGANGGGHRKLDQRGANGGGHRKLGCMWRNLCVGCALRSRARPNRAIDFCVERMHAVQMAVATASWGANGGGHRKLDQRGANGGGHRKLGCMWRNLCVGCALRSRARPNRAIDFGVDCLQSSCPKLC